MKNKALEYRPGEIVKVEISPDRQPELPSTSRMIYPEKDDTMYMPSKVAYDAALKDIRDEAGELFTLQANEKKLLTTLKNILRLYQKEGKPALVTLNYIINRDNGEKDMEITPLEKKRYMAMLVHFMYPVILPSAKNTITQFAKISIIQDEVIINGMPVKNSIYIEGVLDVPANIEVPYYILRLPKGYGNTVENVAMQLEIFNQLGKDPDNRQIDFDAYCDSIGLSKQEKSKKSKLHTKFEKMIEHYQQQSAAFIGIKLNRKYQRERPAP